MSFYLRPLEETPDKDFPRAFVSAMKDAMKIMLRNCNKDKDDNVLKFYTPRLDGSEIAESPQLTPNPLFDQDEDIFAVEDDLIFEPQSTVLKGEELPKIDDDPMNAEADDEGKEDENEENDEDEEEVYEVEKVVDKQGTGKNLLYLVKWKGWELPEDQTWEPLANLKNAKHLVTEFEKSLKKKPGRRSDSVSKKKLEDENSDSEDEAVIMCNDCLIIMLSKKAMKRHRETCGKESSSPPKDEKKSAKTPEKKTAVCFKCLEEYSRVSELKTHLLDHFEVDLRAKLPERKPWTCPTCSKKFPGLKKLIAHFAYDHEVGSECFIVVDFI